MKSLNLSFVPVMIGLLFVLLIVQFFSLQLGAIETSFNDVITALAQLIKHDEAQYFEQDIIIEMRLPRTVLAILVGGLLGLAGVLIQTLVKNPMADPYLLGVSNGAALAVVIVICLGNAMVFQPIMIPLAACLGGLTSFILVMALAHNSTNSLNTTKLILAGIAISFMLSAITSMIMIRADSHLLPGIMQWMMGSMADAQWPALPLLALVLGSALLLARLYHRYLDVLLLGDEKAATLGVNLSKHRLIWSILVAILTGVAVSQAGIVGFIGLMVPHFARFLVGGAHKFLLPVATVLGMLLSLGVDLLCRTLIAPEELPMGIPMAIIAMPFFIFLLRSRYAH